MPNSSGNIAPLQTSTTPPKLIVSHSEARQKLEAHIEKGRELVRRLISSEEEMDIALAEGDKWRDYAIRLLATLFDSPSLSDEFRDKTRRISFPLYGRPSYIDERDDFKKRVNNRIKELESILESLDLYKRVR